MSETHDQTWWAPELNRWQTWLSLGFGVVLPAAAIAFEAHTGLLADIVTSPMPTRVHLALMVLVVVSNLLTQLAGPRLAPRLHGPSALALGVAGTYSLLFVPLIPLSLLGLMVLGIGVLGFAPFGALGAAIHGRRRLHRVVARPPSTDWDAATYRKVPAPTPPRALGRLLPPLLLGPALLLGLEVPAWTTLSALEDARSPEVEVAAPGVERLRAFGDREVLARACVGHGRAVGGLTGLLAGPQPSRVEMEAIHYRAFGTPCPSIREQGRRFAGGFRTRPSLDFDRGSDRIGGVDPEVRLAGSSLDGSVDGNAAAGYLEWTLRFENRGVRNAEARALVELPPGAVVSRATLWIEGEPREAAFGPQGAVKGAYRDVVRRARDPLLVTHAGPDRVLVQCFPIAPDGGEMKVRIGVTMPLELRGEADAAVPAPRLLARNFALDAGLQHHVWIESDQALRRGGAELPSGTALTLEAQATERGDLGVTVRRAPSRASTWSRDPHAPDTEIEQRLLAEVAEPPARLVVVVDTSASMRGAAEWLQGAWSEAPDGVPSALVLAGDRPVPVPTLAPMSDDLRTRWRQALDEASFEGGKDNVPALQAALATGATVLWIHGAQPLLLKSVDGIEQRWRRDPRGRLLHLQVGPGDDRVVGALAASPQLGAVPRRGTAADDLGTQLARWSGRAPFFRRTLERRPAPGNHVAPATSDHLARLWAARRVQAQIADDREAATALAVEYQLVTPVSGAVVLETAAQYEGAGLEPVDPDSVPSVPEPETWALLLCAAGAMLWWSRRPRWRLA